MDGMNEDFISWDELGKLFKQFAEEEMEAFWIFSHDPLAGRLFDVEVETRVLEHFGFTYEKYYLKTVGIKGVRIVKFPGTLTKSVSKGRQ